MIKRIWNKWKKIAEKIGNFQATIIFSILYFLIVSPIGIIFSLFSDPLDFKSKPSWKKIPNNPSSLEKLVKP